jgi:spore germination protein (amino acid permease)
VDKFNAKHFAFLILGVSIVSLKTYPGVYLRNGGRESWVAIIIASAIIFFVYLYLIGISEKANRPNICEIYQVALGKRLGNILISLFVITLLITLVESCSVEANAMRENMLTETPNWYFLLFFIPPCIYVVTRDLVSVITVTVIGIVLIIIAGINLGILTARYKHFQLLFPIFRNGITMDFFICLVKMIGLYGCTSIVLPFLSRIEDTTKSMFKSTIAGLIMLIQMQIVSVSGLVMTFVPARFKSLNYPKLIQTQLVSYSQFIEFGELYVMLQILGGWLLKYIITFSAIIVILSNLNINKRCKVYIVYITSAFVYGGACFTSKNLFVLFKLLNYYSYLCLLNFVLIPLVVYTLFDIKSKRINN